ncbi:MAG TPA: bifunctional (p)ppGpp synthetase/guanosine-3',5'-bis(diphosphate) 3'-pyrophosphohydrolase [Leucothrix mucor]|uniref:GTP pyrophosphokinase n=1 Tax=Leucothrix mucor TaxID=45248 RepID=A0A7V2WUG3_LEUMU|nr:bifunctional (p)ppGpp synthetase/guanosine-3',5'-bis(diphosphate) 3'-pyrophosphohydrolase [Leucothrix mucor]
MQHSHLIKNAEYTHDEWIERLWVSNDKTDKQQVSDAVNYMLQIESSRRVEHVPISLDVANILLSLQVDQETLIAALLSDIGLNEIFSIEDIEQKFDSTIAQLVKNMRLLHNFKSPAENGLAIPAQAENLRRMLLAIVDDVRAVLIRLAWNLQQLRLAAKIDDTTKQAFATETMAIYAPLANRLGISQLKWEMEDLAFRYLEPDCYQRIAKSLATKRLEREAYIEHFTSTLQDLLTKDNIEAKVYGRPKHIYSIWKKMQHKQIDFDQLYDLRAVRVIVENDRDCYAVISNVHAKWQYIPEEFDDYINNRKPNGYQSLHTVIIGPENKAVEIQIRTNDMHLFAELGVAAHWRYKEGGSQNADMERVVSSLRRLLENDESDSELLEDFQADVFPDRVFVLTPHGEILDLSKGSTPIDFAYTIHTHVGHLCKGARVNGAIVPLDYKLRNGDKVEIITGKVEQPRRKWLNPTLKYVGSAGTRTKIRHWFRQQDHEKNLHDGMSMLEEEQHRLGIKKFDISKLVKRFKLQSKREFLIGLGRGDISVVQLADTIDIPDKHQVKLRKVNITEKSNHQGIQIQGVGNLLVEISNCCQPVPGDEIIGYISIGRGIKIHRTDCTNIQQKNLTSEQQLRLTDASWGTETTAYTVDIQVTGFNQPGFLRDVADVFAKQQINVSNISHIKGKTDLISILNFEVLIENLKKLSAALGRIEELANVMDVRRKS